MTKRECAIFYTPREKLPEEGSTVLVQTIICGLLRLRYEKGKFVSDKGRERIELGPKKIIKWRYPDDD